MKKKSVGKMKKQKMSVISVFKGEVRLTDERHTIGTNKKLVVDLINQEKNRSSHQGQDLFEVGPKSLLNSDIVRRPQNLKKISHF